MALITWTTLSSLSGTNLLLIMHSDVPSAREPSTVSHRSMCPADSVFRDTSRQQAVHATLDSQLSRAQHLTDDKLSFTSLIYFSDALHTKNMVNWVQITASRLNS